MISADLICDPGSFVDGTIVYTEYSAYPYIKVGST